MDYYGLLFLYYLKGLSGKSVLKLFFNIEAGGTEQLLPENTSTPTTTPILADIQYPDGLRTDQYFTYRETPTTVSNKARIKTIKGNTLNWNQLVEYGDFSTSSGWSGQFATVTISNNVASVRQDRVGDYVALRKSTLQGLTGHKYLVVADVKSAKKTAIAFYLSNAYSSAYDIQANTRTVVRAIITVSNANNSGFNVYTNRKVELAEGDVIEIYHVMCFDLTQMGLDITDPSEFTSLFPLSYYSYNQGSLLSFNGNGIKTVGFNQWDEEWEVGTLDDSTGENRVSTGSIRSVNYIQVLPNTTYYIHVGSGINMRMLFYDGGMNYLGDIINANNGTFTTPANAHYMRFRSYTAYGTTYLNDICINISDLSKNGTYEPYTSSTLSLPISTYFPNGMKSAGTAYDELTPIKASTRIGTDDLGSLDWRRNPNVNGGFNCRVDGMKLGVSGQMSSVICPLYETINTKYYGIMNTMQNMQIAQSNATQGELYLINTSYSDVDTFKQAMSGTPLYFELATPIETPITTEDANEALSLLMGKSVYSNNAKQMIDIITKGE